MRIHWTEIAEWAGEFTVHVLTQRGEDIETFEYSVWRKEDQHWVQRYQKRHTQHLSLLHLEDVVRALNLADDIIYSTPPKCLEEIPSLEDKYPELEELEELAQLEGGDE